MNVTVPQLAEGVEGGSVVSIFVKEGDSVTEGQDLLELETEKATAAIPATGSGTVSKIHVKEGDEVRVGQTLITIEGGSGESAPQETQVKPQAAPASQPVGQPLAAMPTVDPKLVEAGLDLAASPTVRRMARQLSIDLRQIPASGRGGRITLDDFKNYVASFQTATSGGQPQAKPLPDFSKWGSVREEKMSQLRKKISEKMTESWTTVPHVTQFDEANITNLMEIAKKHSSEYEKQGAKLTLTVLVLKALISSLKKHPKFNASIDVTNKKIIYKEYINFGIAVDTEQGLIVPVIKNVDQKSTLELAKELRELAEKTRARKIDLEDLQGGTFTISNQGGIGGGVFTPIVNTPEVAILGLARGVKKPIVTKDGKMEIDMVLPLSLSYDHRLIDGGDAARFITDFVQALESFDEKEVKL